MSDAKQARWQKNPSLVHHFGGRAAGEGPNRVFDITASLNPPRASDKLPIYLEDEPPKDMFFPVTLADIAETLAKLPREDTSGITHVWLRRPKASEFRNGRIPFAEYVYADGIFAVVFYPWPENMAIPLAKKPGDAILNRYKKWGPKLFSHKAKWRIEWNPEVVRDFYLSDLILQEIGRHMKFQRQNMAYAEAKGLEAPQGYATQRFFEDTVTIR